MEHDYKPFEEAVTAGIHPLIFIHNLKLKKTLEHMDGILEDIEDEFKEPGISFVFDDTLSLTYVQSIGTVLSKCITGKETRPVITDMKIKSKEKVDVKLPDEKLTPLITGSLFMPNDELVLCDCVNSSVKVFNTDFTLKESVKLPSKPWHLCRMRISKVVIILNISKTTRPIVIKFYLNHH